MELAAAQRDPPVDPAQPVAGAERPDVGELGALPRAAASGWRRPGRAAAAPRPGSRTARSAAAPAACRRQSRPAPSGSRPTASSAPTCSSPSIRRPQRRGLTSIVGRLVARGRRAEARRRVHGDVRRWAAHAGDVLDVRRASRSSSREVVPWPSCSDRGRARRRPAARVGTVHQAERRDAATNGAPSTITAGVAGQHRDDHPDRADDQRPAQRRRGPPAAVTRPLTRCRGWPASGPGRARRRRRSGRWPRVIHSSGRTVIRCASTARATALTSSGMT